MLCLRKWEHWLLGTKERNPAWEGVHHLSRLHQQWLSGSCWCFLSTDLPHAVTVAVSSYVHQLCRVWKRLPPLLQSPCTSSNQIKSLHREGEVGLCSPPIKKLFVVHSFRVRENQFYSTEWHWVYQPHPKADWTIENSCQHKMDSMFLGESSLFVVAVAAAAVMLFCG